MLEMFEIVVMAFICELVDNSLGGGFGTILSPAFLLFGYNPLEVVPAILFSCCLKKIMKGEDCLIFFNYPESPEKNEFDVFYLCIDCGGR